MDFMYRFGYLLGSIQNLFSPVKFEVITNKQTVATKEPNALAVSVSETPERKTDIEIGPNQVWNDEGLTRVQELTGVGLVTMRIYPSKGIVNSKLTITNKRLAKKVGFEELKLDSINLSGQLEGDMSISDIARMKVVRVVETLLCERLGGEKPAVNQKSDPAKKREEEPGAPVVTKPDPPASKVPMKQAESKDRPVYIGQFVEAGTAKRTNGADKDAKPGSKGKRTFSQFYVDYLDQNLGYKKNRVWGADLERAVKEAGVEKGDMIQITYLGVVPVEITEDDQPKMVHRKSYEIIKI